MRRQVVYDRNISNPKWLVKPRRAVSSSVQFSFGLYLLDRGDRVLRELDALLPAKQPQQHHHALVWTQRRQHTDVILQWSLQDAHARAGCDRRWLRQLDQAVTSNDRWAAIDQRIKQHIELARESVLQSTREMLGEFRAELRVLSKRRSARPR